MSVPVLVTLGDVDVLSIDRAVETPGVVSVSPVESLVLSTDAMVGQGVQGPKGDPPTVSRYGVANAAIVGGVLALNASAASTFWVSHDQDVTGVVVTDWPADQTQRVHVYMQQDGVGGRGFAANAWPAGTLWSLGVRPSAISAGEIQSFVIEHLPDGRSFAAIVGQLYQ